MITVLLAVRAEKSLCATSDAGRVRGYYMYGGTTRAR